MLFYKNLEDIIFNRHEIFESDELIVLSGYLGPKPVDMLNDLPIKSTVIYGMYGESGIGNKLHDKLVNIDEHSKKVEVVYSKIPIHSKCYLWKKNNRVIHALVGSANFSINGLKTPYREVLAETTRDTFDPLNDYVSMILRETIPCYDHVIDPSHTVNIANKQQSNEEELYTVSLLMRNGETPQKSGVNWGHGVGNVSQGDAYLPISTSIIREFSSLFPPKKAKPDFESPGSRTQRQNDSIEIIWDDGTTMEGLLEGTQLVEGISYPKQISSSPRKNILGIYLRKRLGLEPSVLVTAEHLKLYGRTNISISLQSEGVYFCDFSVKR